MSEIKTKIMQRFDTLINWNNANPVLLSGEIAVVDCENQIRFKIGDGAKTFTELKFADENMLSTVAVYANNIQQGLQCEAVPTGFAAGIYAKASGTASQALGFASKSLSSYSFTWNGDTAKAPEHLNGTPYSDHGEGTFNVNPKEGLNGFYIGDTTISSLLSSFVSESELLSRTNYRLYSPTTQSGAYTLERNAVNSVSLAQGQTASINIAAKATEDSTSRDLLLRLDCSSCTTNPTVTWNIGNIVTFKDDVWEGDMNVPEAGHIYLFTFTEIQDGEFLAVRKELNA